MVVLQHEHSLTLEDLNPNFPQDEEVYEDEERLIIKQAFNCPCDRCGQEITYMHRYYYKCGQCDYSLHKLCEKIPTTLKHPSHNSHTLTLILDKSGLHGGCHICKSVSTFNQILRYYCSECPFKICLDCCSGELQYHTIYHPSHQHPLVPIRKQISAHCDACGKEHKGVFYQCITCFHSFIHKDCVFRPKRLLIQDGRYERLFHTHPLILSYSFPKMDKEAKFYPSCRVCDTSFYYKQNSWLYKCEKCRFYAHLACVKFICKLSDPGARITSSNNFDDYEDDAALLHLPVSDQTYNFVKDFVFKKTNERCIAHNSHEHPLVLVDEQCDDNTTPRNKVGNDLCNGCIRPIMDMSFYKCSYNNHECNFVLHEWCTRLPDKLKDYLSHPQHTLFLLPKAPENFLGVFYCDVCHYPCNGFAYCCVRCDFKVDVWCAFIPEIIKHKAHPTHLLSRLETRLEKIYCRMCLLGFRWSDKETSLSCKICNFHLHMKCALLLPETINLKFDKHPMSLNYGPIENYEGDYYCEACEEELNPNACFYHCNKCVQSLHTWCAPLIFPSKLEFADRFSWPYSYYPNMKFKSIHKIEGHPHPLSFLKGTLFDGNCNKCGYILREYFILQCKQCRFSLHAFCALGHRK